MKLETNKYRRELRHKENKTNEEKAFLEMYNILADISNTLVEESKWHITREQALEEIRKTISRLNYI